MTINRFILTDSPLGPLEWALQDHLAIAHPLLEQIASSSSQDKEECYRKGWW